MLRDISNLTKDVVSKNSIISKVFLKKILEFFLYHRIFGLKATLLLVLLLKYCLIEKQGGKKDLLQPIGSTGFEMVLILLEETIVI